MKKVLVILIALMLSISFCKKEDELIVTCQGDCHNYSFKIGDESGAYSYSMSISYIYDSQGLASATGSGSITFDNTGNTYQLYETVNYRTCKYNVKVTFEGNTADCGN
jgi:hypothetical protein